MGFHNNIKLLLEDLDLQIQQLKDKYVGEGKSMSDEDFAKIQNVTGNKFYLLAWLTKRVGNKMIKSEDIYKYKEYFDIFEKNKKKFTHKDINLYKTSEDLKKFLDEVINVREGDIVFDEIQGKDNYVSQNEIEKLESTGGMKYLGMFEDETAKKNFKYQVFQIYGVDKNTWKTYRDILGKCKGREKGAKIEICTIADFEYFKDYLKDPKGSSYFLLYNLDDPKSPYQLHYESGQFLDKNDNPNIGFDQIKFFEFVGEKVPMYDIHQENHPSEFELPVKNKGYKDEKGRKQGLWKQSRNGKLHALYTYKNDEENGPYATFFFNGSLERKGNLGKGGVVGDYLEYHDNGKIFKKGEYNNNGQRIGTWVDGLENGFYTFTDYNNKIPQMSGFTKENKLRFVSSAVGGDRYSEPYGNIILFYPSGSVYATGRIGKDEVLLGDWVFYSPDGRIKSEGKFVRGFREGEWVDVLQTTNGKKYIFVADFARNFPKDKIKIYDEKGKFIKNINPWNIKPSKYWYDLRPNLQKFRG